MTLLTSIVLLLALAFVWLVAKTLQIGRRDSGLPPGPPTQPLFGNLLAFPKGSPHYQFTRWAKRYGEIYSLKLGPKTIIVITGASPAKELMERRSGSTVDRPPLYVGDIVVGGMNILLARYTVKWRMLRKAVHAMLTPQATLQHLPIQQAEASQLAFDILKTPEAFYTHVRRYSSSVILSVLFGVRSPRYEGGRVAQFFAMQHEWERIVEPGAQPPIDLIPILKYVPERWAPWKTLCRKVRAVQQELYFGMLEECERRIANGLRNGCFMESLLDRQKELALDRESVGYLGGALVEGGSDTTSAFLHSLILAMISYPEAQKKAQQELDSVVGHDRIPALDDMASLPYIQAVIYETHRWRPVAPLAAPHATIKEEFYNGYCIPAGATILVNTWGIYHDENIYEDPTKFWPDRFIKSEFGTRDGVDDVDRRHTLPFGFGRRMCPAVNLANNSLFDKIKDPQTGDPIHYDLWDYKKGIVTGPNPFRCTITPRSTRHAELIEQAFYASTETFLPFEGEMSGEDKRYAAAMRGLSHLFK
ncbi:hypothetical protein BOTBODRAFT_379163 [Botryobasidium botryosum FD-172 SS1]|uniref:Cytochrome P450 n=1 Tax=Botryobasidium botryosum (strain FD-172 SS1) TaxID=930990 RepID=A0A067MXB0_BOTB1|nr:hypothetical protein BOTBODRAFT_379163 [Botryobasidium botryosum FD-172 SS1]